MVVSIITLPSSPIVHECTTTISLVLSPPDAAVKAECTRQVVFSSQFSRSCSCGVPNKKAAHFERVAATFPGFAKVYARAGWPPPLARVVISRIKRFEKRS
jgi:hypothetical protein